MNSCLLSLCFLSAESVVGNVTTTLASCLLTQYQKTKDGVEQLFSYPIQVYSYGYYADALACLNKDSRILVFGKLWTPNDKLPVARIEAKHVLICYEGRPINEVSLVGRQGKNAEAVVFSSGKVLAKSSIAMDRTKESSHWYNIQAWNKTADILINYGKKGQLLSVEGYLEINEWTQENAQRQSIRVNANQVKLLSPKDEGKVSTTSTEEVEVPY